MPFSIFVKTKNLHSVAEVVKETCSGFLIENTTRKVKLVGENVENPLEEKYAIDVYVEFGLGTLKMLFSVVKLNKKIVVIRALKRLGKTCSVTGDAIADFIAQLTEELIEKFGFDNVKWLNVPYK